MNYQASNYDFIAQAGQGMGRAIQDMPRAADEDRQRAAQKQAQMNEPLDEKDLDAAYPEMLKAIAQRHGEETGEKDQLVSLQWARQNFLPRGRSQSAEEYREKYLYTQPPRVDQALSKAKQDYYDKAKMALMVEGSTGAAGQGGGQPVTAPQSPAGPQGLGMPPNAAPDQGAAPQGIQPAGMGMPPGQMGPPKPAGNAPTQAAPAAPAQAPAQPQFTHSYDKWKNFYQSHSLAAKDPDVISAMGSAMMGELSQYDKAHPFASTHQAEEYIAEHYGDIPKELQPQVKEYVKSAGDETRNDQWSQKESLQRAALQFREAKARGEIRDPIKDQEQLAHLSIWAEQLADQDKTSLAGLEKARASFSSQYPKQKLTDDPAVFKEAVARWNEADARFAQQIEDVKKSQLENEKIQKMLAGIAGGESGAKLGTQINPPKPATPQPTAHKKPLDAY